MGLFDILHKTIGGAIGAVKGAADVLPTAVTTVATHVGEGISSPPSLPNLAEAITSAASTPHPSGSGKTVLEHYAELYGTAAVAAVTAIAVPHIPFIPSGIKTAGSAALAALAVRQIDAGIHKLEAPYTGAPA